MAKARSAFLRGRVAMATNLANSGGHAAAQKLLAELAPDIEGADATTAALYFMACGSSYRRGRLVDDSFLAFESSLKAARAVRNPRLRLIALGNYADALVQDGNIDHALALYREALGLKGVGISRLELLINAAEGSYVAGDLRRAASLLHEFYAVHDGRLRTEHLLNAAATGIPVAILFADRALLQLSSDRTVVDLAFVNPGQSQLLGRVAGSFCLLFEHLGRRKEHDALLDRAVAVLTSLDESLPLALRVARLGAPDQVLRMKTLMTHWVASSPLMCAYRALFDSFIASRHRLRYRARKLALQASRDFSETGRPLLEALALEAAGSNESARNVRHRCGSSASASQFKWLGAPLPRRMGTHLTDRERQVAELAAGGSTNRAIASKLGLSERTVHCHCRAIYGKLGVRSRWQLATILTDPHSE